MINLIIVLVGFSSALYFEYIIEIKKPVVFYLLGFTFGSAATVAVFLL